MVNVTIYSSTMDPMGMLKMMENRWVFVNQYWVNKKNEDMRNNSPGKL
jgi:hypothetical protein